MMNVPIKPITPEQAVEALRKRASTGDPEQDHARADDVLCDVLESLGYHSLVEQWNKIEKWYA